MAGPLSGVRILDLTSVVAGPLATQMLGDMGADVIKIEAPEGDAPRHTGPARSPGMAALFMGLNRSKRSLVLDLKIDAAKDALWRLIASADVLVHSMRPQKIEKLGFGHETVCAKNPRLVYAALHGYRDGGPYSGQPAYDAANSWKFRCSNRWWLSCSASICLVTTSCRRLGRLATPVSRRPGAVRTKPRTAIFA
jgi:crotonobetainyl-CoA:carnitine CoA-transferase CaiB-like acyl-CoA transferase